MNKIINTIIIALTITAITTASASVVKVYVLENDIAWMKTILTRIEKHLDKE